VIKIPSPLRYYKRDPNGRSRGEGAYYHRGNGIYSKYNIERDRKIKAKGYKLNRVGLPFKSSILHTGDGNLPRWNKMPYYLVKKLKSSFTYIHIPKELKVAYDKSINGYVLVLRNGGLKKYPGFILTSAKSGKAAIRKVFGWLIMINKTCAVCKKPVHQGDGVYYYNNLVHRQGCKGLMKRYPWRFKRWTLTNK